jgi:DNA-binding XRE family transcriptional regulator
MYRLTQSETTVHRLTDNAFIPFDGGNRDYQEYLEWLAEGNEPEPYVAPPAPPVTQVTAYQAKIQLSRSGLYDSVVTTVNTSDNPELKIAWEVATSFERNSPFILALQPELGLTDAQVDDLFQQASQIS